jgi:hypothetical protein
MIRLSFLLPAIARMCLRRCVLQLDYKPYPDWPIPYRAPIGGRPTFLRPSETMPYSALAGEI